MPKSKKEESSESDSDSGPEDVIIVKTLIISHLLHLGFIISAFLHHLKKAKNRMLIQNRKVAQKQSGFWKSSAMLQYLSFGDVN